MSSPCGCGDDGCTDIPELTEKDMANAKRKFKWPKRVVFEFPDGEDAHGFLAFMSDGGGEQQCQLPYEDQKYWLDFDYGWTGGPYTRPRVENGEVVVKVTRAERDSE